MHIFILKTESNLFNFSLYLRKLKIKMGRDKKPKSNHSKNSPKNAPLKMKELTIDLQHFLDTNNDEVFTKSQIVKEGKFSDAKEISMLFSALDKLVADKKLIFDEAGKTYQSAFKPQILEGIVDHVNPRFAYFICEGFEKDPIIENTHLNAALDGDKVKVMIVPSKNSRDDERLSAEVIEIITRKREEFVGKVQKHARVCFVIADSKKIHEDFLVDVEDSMDANDGDKVVVKIIKYTEGMKNPKAKIVKVLGKAGEHNVEIHSIMAEYGLPMEFEKHIDDEANAISEKISKEEIKKRRDFRDILTFTIDPHDAKDFDDAISFQVLENGNFEIGVHIADVTHYVEPKTMLEKEAQRRATSVYLVDRCVPMLPEKLSNGLCSLRPNEEKLTFSAVFEIDENAKIIKEWFGKSIIYSDQRFAYEEAQEIIEGKTFADIQFVSPPVLTSSFLNKNSDLEAIVTKAILTLNDLHLKLRKERFNKGAINFETVEVKFVLDEKGKPLKVVPKVRKAAHMLIEEFMLLANKRVAQFCFDYKKGKEQNVMVYRTHDQPDVEKLRSFSLFAKKFGYKLEPESTHISKELNKLLDDIVGKPEQNMLESIAIRSMAKAKYTTLSMGHFGLAFEHYSHFTSPIRRYPDMMCHRLLENYLQDKPISERALVEENCKHSSEMEKLAAEAERASIKYKQAEYMANMMGQDFEGIVSGVTEWGVFVEITETKCEGLVRYVDMRDDHYDLDPGNYRAIGRKNGSIIQFGDKKTVRVKAVDLEKRTIDLVMAGDDGSDYQIRNEKVRIRR